MFGLQYGWWKFRRIFGRRWFDLNSKLPIEYNSTERPFCFDLQLAFELIKFFIFTQMQLCKKTVRLCFFSCKVEDYSCNHKAAFFTHTYRRSFNGRHNEKLHDNFHRSELSIPWVLVNLWTSCNFTLIISIRDRFAWIQSECRLLSRSIHFSAFYKMQRLSWSRRSKTLFSVHSALALLFCSINKFSLIAHRIDTKMDSTKFSAFYSTFVRFVFKFIA